MSARVSMEAKVAALWQRVGTRWLPFADAATDDLPLSRLLRLSLVQITVGLATALLIGTLNRVLIVEFALPAWVISTMVALPLVFAPFRTFIGFRSDHHRSLLGWRRVPYIWFGTMLQFGGLAIMPFALMLLSGAAHAPVGVGIAGAGLSFLLTGAGLQTTQTAGLALAMDLSKPENRPRVAALMYVMLFVGIAGTGLVFGQLLRDFSPLRLVQVIQGAAVVTLFVNLVAIWKQEGRGRLVSIVAQPDFAASWRAFMTARRSVRFLVTVALGTAAFNMQDIVLEPYGGEVLHLSVAETTALTAMLAGGALCAFAYAARVLSRQGDPMRLCAVGVLVGMVGFSAVLLAAPVVSAMLFRLGACAIGFGGGLFAVGTLAATMERGRGGEAGLAVGALGAVQTAAMGLAVAFGGSLRDLVGVLARGGYFGPALVSPATGYGAVYVIEVLLLLAVLVALGPLVRSANDRGFDSIRSVAAG